MARRTSRHVTSRVRAVRRLPLLAVSLLAAGLALAGILAGCGGGSDSELPATTPEDRSSLERVTEQIVGAAKTRDTQAFCDLVQPSLIEEAFGGRKGCLKVARASMVPQSPLARLEIEDIVTDGEGAIVTYAQEPPGDVLFAKEGGRWYIALNELAEARRDAMAEARQDARERNGQQ